MVCSHHPRKDDPGHGTSYSLIPAHACSHICSHLLVLAAVSTHVTRFLFPSPLATPPMLSCAYLICFMAYPPHRMLHPHIHAGSDAHVSTLGHAHIHTPLTCLMYPFYHCPLAPHIVLLLFPLPLLLPCFSSSYPHFPSSYPCFRCSSSACTMPLPAPHTYTLPTHPIKGSMLTLTSP